MSSKEGTYRFGSILGSMAAFVIVGAVGEALLDAGKGEEISLFWGPIVGAVLGIPAGFVDHHPKHIPVKHS